MDYMSTRKIEAKGGGVRGGGEAPDGYAPAWLLTAGVPSASYVCALVASSVRAEFVDGMGYADANFEK